MGRDVAPATSQVRNEGGRLREGGSLRASPLASPVLLLESKSVLAGLPASQSGHMAAHGLAAPRLLQAPGTTHTRASAHYALRHTARYAALAGRHTWPASPSSCATPARLAMSSTATRPGSACPPVQRAQWGQLTRQRRHRRRRCSQRQGRSLRSRAGWLQRPRLQLQLSPPGEQLPSEVAGGCGLRACCLSAFSQSGCRFRCCCHLYNKTFGPASAWGAGLRLHPAGWQLRLIPDGAGGQLAIGIPKRSGVSPRAVLPVSATVTYALVSSMKHPEMGPACNCLPLAVFPARASA